MGFKNRGICMYSEFPETVTYFKEEIFCKTLSIPTSKPELESICDVFINLDIISQKLIKTDIGLSNEGQRLSGYELGIEVGIEQKVTYVADEPTQSIFAVHYDFLKSVFISLPEYISGKSVCDLFKSSRLMVRPFLQHSYTRELDERDFNTCMLLFLDVQIC